jgi:hypothetical protein
MTSSLSKAQHEWMVKPGDSGTVMVPRGTSPSTVGVVSEEYKNINARARWRLGREEEDESGEDEVEKQKEQVKVQGSRRRNRIRGVVLYLRAPADCPLSEKNIIKVRRK